MRRKTVQLFLLHAAFFLALIALVPGPREIVPRAFHAVGNSLFRSFGDHLSVRFQWADPTSRPDSADTRMLGREFGKLNYRWKVVYSSFRRIFWPSAVFVAMTLATPMSRRRRILSLPIGLALFNALFLLQIALFAAVLFGVVGSLGGASPATWKRALPIAEAMINSPVTNFSLAFLLWAWLAKPAQGITAAALTAQLNRLLQPSRAAKPRPAAVDPPQPEAPRAAKTPPDAPAPDDTFR
jgi:hypothetical protein